jgi:hypothetical protein
MIGSGFISAELKIMTSLFKVTSVWGDPVEDIMCECSVCTLSGTSIVVMSHCDIHHQCERRDPIVFSEWQDHIIFYLDVTVFIVDNRGNFVCFNPVSNRTKQQTDWLYTIQLYTGSTTDWHWHVWMWSPWGSKLNWRMFHSVSPVQFHHFPHLLYSFHPSLVHPPFQSCYDRKVSFWENNFFSDKKNLSGGWIRGRDTRWPWHGD